MRDSEQLTKITAKLYAPMHRDFDRQVSDALLRRDAFLDRVIAVEARHLREDLAGKRNSEAARRHIAGKLKAMGKRGDPQLRQVSVAVRASTAEALREAAEAHNLSRDAFLNRLIALLRSTDKLLDQLGLPKRVAAFRRDGSADAATSPLRAIEETQSDPLYYLRSACREIHGCGLHALPFPPSLAGLSCHLDDSDVPGTAAHAERAERERVEPL